MSWHEGILGDLLVFQRGHDLPDYERKPGEVPVVGSAGVNGYHNVEKAPAPCVTIGRSGASIGKPFYLNAAFWPHNACLYVKDFKGNNPKYLFYLLGRMALDQFNSGAAQPSLNRNFLYGAKVRYPERAEQDRIAAALSTYDDLIENNRRRIALLEDAARQLYKEWFVRFRFPGHEHIKVDDGVPEGWSKENLFELATATYGHAFKSELFSEEQLGRPVVRIRDVPDRASGTWTTEGAPEDKTLENGDFLIGMDGDFHMNFWAGGMAWLNQRVVRLTGNDKFTTGLLRNAIEQQIKDLNATITGTTVKHLGAKHLKQVSLLVPTDPLLDQANEYFENVRNLVVNLSVANQQLAKARDLLLPKLMNGTLTV